MFNTHAVVVGSAAYMLDRDLLFENLFEVQITATPQNLVALRTLGEIQHAYPPQTTIEWTEGGKVLLAGKEVADVSAAAMKATHRYIGINELKENQVDDGALCPCAMLFWVLIVLLSRF